MKNKLFPVKSFVFVSILLLTSCNGGKSSFTVTWKNYNNAVLEVDENVKKGTMPSYDGKTPIQKEKGGYSFTFIGWNPELSPVANDITYTAVFEKTEIPASIVIKTEDKKEIHTMDSISRTYFEMKDDKTTENDEIAEYLHLNKDKNSCGVDGAYFEWTGYKTTTPYSFTIAKDEKLESVVTTRTNISENYTKFYNLIPGKYFYQISDSSEVAIKSSVYSFTIVDQLRTLYTKNEVANFRDIGGYKTMDGKTIKYGLIYRSANIAKASTNFEDVAKNTIKLKTELDVRKDYKTSEHPLDYVNFFNYGLTDYYPGMISDSTTIQNLKNIFNLISDSKNLPLDYHCTNGADRTGLLSFMIEGALGVSDEDIFKDYETTTFYRYYLPRSDIENKAGKYYFRNDGYRESTSDNGSMLKVALDLKSAYGTKESNISEVVVNFLTTTCGVSLDTINAFRNLMLE